MTTKIKIKNDVTEAASGLPTGRNVVDVAINGAVFDSRTAEFICGEVKRSGPNREVVEREELYKTRSGHFFLWGLNDLENIHYVKRLTVDAAYKIAARRKYAKTLKRIFGDLAGR